MEDNPFGAFWNDVKSHANSRAKTGYRLGTVSRETPLSVNIAGLEFTGKELLINPDIRELKAGDRVFTVPNSDDSQFYVLCKLVAP